MLQKLLNLGETKVKKRNKLWNQPKPKKINLFIGHNVRHIKKAQTHTDKPIES